MRINVEINDETIGEIIEQTRKEMAQEVLSYLAKRKLDFQRENTESKFTLYGIGICENKLERYL